MEPQETIYCYNKEEKCCFKNRCLAIIATILLAAFAVVIGLIIGASIAGAILEALSAVIVLAVVLGLLLILDVILILCNRKKKERKCKCKPPAMVVCNKNIVWFYKMCRYKVL